MPRPKRKFSYAVHPPDNYDTEQLTQYHKDGTAHRWRNFVFARTLEDARKWARKFGIGATIYRRYLHGKHKGREHAWDYVGFKNNA